MARPITWNDVAGPAQTPGILFAANQAARQIQESLSGLGTSFENVGDEQRTAATDAAIASIANSADPTAAAAAIPKGWQFDPLQIAGAKNVREGQLLDTKVKNLNLEDQLSKKTDRESARLVSALVAPLADDVRAGKEPELDMTNPLWQTPSGMEALKYLDSQRAVGVSERNEQARLNIERARLAQGDKQAKLADMQLAQIQARKNTDDKYTNWLATPAGLRATPEDKLRTGRAIGEAEGAGAAYGASMAAGNKTEFGVSDTDMQSASPDGFTYKAAQQAVTAMQVALGENQLVQDNMTNLTLADFNAMEKNDYAGASESAVNDMILKNNPEFADGALWTSTDWEEIQERRDSQRQRAAEEGRRMAKEKGWDIPKDFNAWLLPEQEANLVELTKGNTWADTADSPAAKRLRQQYVAVNITGGMPAAKQRLANEQVLTKTEIAKLDQVRREIQAAQMEGKPVPAEAKKIWMLHLQGLSK